MDTPPPSWKRRGPPLRLAAAAALLISTLGSAWAQSPLASPMVHQVDGVVELDTTITVHVRDLEAWARDNDAHELVPFLNGRPIAGNRPMALDIAHGRVLFHLGIDNDNQATWVDLLGAPSGLHRKVTFSIGPEGGAPFATRFDSHNRLPLVLISPLYGLAAMSLASSMLLIFIVLARTTSIIRKPVPSGLGPYDLGRFQMAVWFFLIYVSYIAIWVITDATDTLNPSLLALLGISAGTALGEAMLDRSDKQASAEGSDVAQLPLEVEREALRQSLDRRDAGHPRFDAQRQRLADVEALLANASSSLRSQGLLRDLLSEAGSYRFDRFQIFAFTLILGVVFISDVYNRLSMPELSPTMLALMGLSSGTYIGFKFPDRS